MKNKKDILIYILLALSGYVFMYLAISFVKMESNPVNWYEINRTILIVIGTAISFFVILIKKCTEFNKP